MVTKNVKLFEGLFDDFKFEQLIIYVKSSIHCINLLHSLLDDSENEKYNKLRTYENTHGFNELYKIMQSVLNDKYINCEFDHQTLPKFDDVEWYPYTIPYPTGITINGNLKILNKFQVDFNENILKDGYIYWSVNIQRIQFFGGGYYLLTGTFKNYTDALNFVKVVYHKYCLLNGEVCEFTNHAEQLGINIVEYSDGRMLYTKLV